MDNDLKAAIFALMSMRKLALTSFFALFLLVNWVPAQTLTLSYFNASPDGSDILVSWEVPDEGGVTTFKIFRKIDGESSWKFLDHVAPTGSNSYNYLDYTLFKDDARNVTYKLQVYKSGVVYTYYTSIVHNPTSVQRTWGSIKAMFR